MADFTTKIPGIACSRQQITPACRANRGIDGALDEAIARIGKAYRELAHDPEAADVTWHISLVREDPANV